MAVAINQEARVALKEIKNNAIDLETMKKTSHVQIRKSLPEDA